MEFPRAWAPSTSRISAAAIPRCGPHSLGGLEWRNGFRGHHFLSNTKSTQAMSSVVWKSPSDLTTPQGTHDRILEAGKHFVESVDALASGNAEAVPQES